MKRSMIPALVLSVCLLGGCSSPAPEHTPDAVPDAPEHSQSVETSPASSGTSEPQPAAPEQPEAPTETVKPLSDIPSGVWLAGTDLGYSNYYHFDTQSQSGSYVSLDYGLGMTFTYAGSGSELVFSLDDHDQPVSATVEHTGEEAFTLIWEDSLPEKLTFVGEGDLEDFHFYSNAELAELAGEHYARLTEEEIPAQSGTLTNEDNTVTVRLYDDPDDQSSTAAWYIVDRFTATGTDVLTGEDIDLLFAAVVEEPTVPTEFPEDTQPTEEIPAEPSEPTEPGEELPSEPVEEPSTEEVPATEAASLM